MLKGIMMLILITLTTSVFTLYENEPNNKTKNIYCITYWTMVALSCIFGVKG